MVIVSTTLINVHATEKNNFCNSYSVGYAFNNL